MSKRTVGYVELEWTCPNCGNRNPGPAMKCATCGTAQPEDVQFEQPVQETLLEDQVEIEKAKAGPDIHCPYCGTRNPAGSTVCRQCGGDLSEGALRKAGQVVGAHRAEAAPPLSCPACGTENPATARQCSNCGAGLAKIPPWSPRRVEGGLTDLPARARMRREVNRMKTVVLRETQALYDAALAELPVDEPVAFERDGQFLAALISGNEYEAFRSWRESQADLDPWPTPPPPTPEGDLEALAAVERIRTMFADTDPEGWREVIEDDLVQLNNYWLLLEEETA